MISPHKTPALAKMAMLLLFAIAAVALLDTTTISAQEPGRTITSPFGIARQTSSLESGSDEDTFVDPETGEVGHIIRNPFGIANPEGVDTGIDIPDNGEEVGGIITSPFGVPASDDIDTGVDVIDEDEEYLISLPDDEESEVEDTEDVEEINDEPSDDEKEKIDKIEFSEDFSRNDESISTKGALPPKDAPRNTGEDLGFDFKLVGTSEGATSVTVNSAAGGTLYVLSGNDFVIEAQPIRGQFPGDPTWTITSNNPGGPTSNSGIPYKTGVTQTSTQKTYTANSACEYGSYTITVRSDPYEHTVIREIDVVVVTLNLTIHNPIGANSDYASLLATNIADESSTNIANESSAEKPDYANFEARSGETSLKRMDLRINFGNLNRNQCNVKFDYDGVDEIPDPNTTTPTIINDDELKYIYKRNQANGYYDYTTKWKQKELRIWASPNNSITDKSSRDCRNYNPTGDNGGNYLAPATYTINQLNPNGNSSACTKILYLEGINPSADTATYTPVTVELYYNSKKIVSKVVRLNIIEGKVILNVNNDPNYTLDEIDHKIKDQQGGFKGWFAKELDKNGLEAAETSNGFENFFPGILKDLSPLPTGLKYVLSVGHPGIMINYDYSVVLNENRMLDYLKYGMMHNHILDETFAVITHLPLYPLENTTYEVISPPNYLEITPSTKKTVPFLFGVHQISNSESLCQNRVSLKVCRGDTNEVLLTLDNALYTFQPIDKFFELFSARQAELTSTWDYPLDPDTDDPTLEYQYPNMPIYDYPERDPLFAETRDSSRNTLIFIHGFNVTEEEARETNRIMFRRMYWSGYRDNYIGLCWRGDDAMLLGEYWDPTKDRWLTIFNFNENVHHAFRTSHAAYLFIEEALNSSNGKEVNLMAHSLGNLVMWDAIRLHTRKQNPKLINNVISVEGAVWSDAFRQKEMLEYDDPFEDYALYTITDLESNSWSHWFRHPSNSVYSVVNKFVNSYTADDEALRGMEISNVILGPYNYHYNREWYGQRNPDNMPNFPALLQYRHPRSYYPRPTTFESICLYAWNFLNPPIGLTDMDEHDLYPISTSSEICTVMNYNVPSSVWDETEHNEMRNALFYIISPWYEQIFSGKTTIISQ